MVRWFSLQSLSSISTQAGSRMVGQSGSRYGDQGSDQELVSRAIQDKQAFAAIVKRYEAPLLRYIDRLGCRNRDVADDLLQEIFIKVYIHLHDYDPFLPFSSWLYRIAHNQIISHFRKEKHRPVSLTGDEVRILMEGLADEGDGTGAQHRRFSDGEVAVALERLEAKYREVVVLKFFEDKSYEEISDILQVPQGTVATLLNRAKKKITHYLGRGG